MNTEFQETIAPYRDEIVSFIKSRVGSGNPEADDILQNSYLALWMALPHFQNRSSMKTYIMSIVHKKIMDYFRRKSRDAKLVKELAGQKVEALRMTLRRHESEAVQKKLHSLTRVEFGIFKLLGQGFSNDLIAKANNISSNTVKSHMKKIHAKLGISDRGRLIYVATAFLGESL